MNKEDYPVYIKDQAVMSTSRDTQGEQVSKEFLEGLVERVPPQFPLGRFHDMSQDIVGYLENFRLVPMDDKDGEWKVIADVHLNESEDVKVALGGFSFGWTEVYRDSSDSRNGCIYLPFPLYNDDSLIDVVLDNNDGISVGKWHQKQAEPETVALIASFVTLLLTPAWQKVYDERVHPFILAALSRCKLLGREDIRCEYGQMVKDQNGGTVHLYFVPDKTRSYDTLLPSLVKTGVEKSIAFLREEPDAIKKGVSLMKLYYDGSRQEYVIFYVQFRNGSFMNYGE